MEAKKDFENIINEYLRNYQKITKEDIDLLIKKTCWHSVSNEGLNCKHFKIINNQLYFSNPRYTDWETRIEAFKYMILETLKKYKIPDCEFIIYDYDGINDSNIHYCIHDNKILPLIVTTSVLEKYHMILCPDFMFTFAPEYSIRNNEEMSREIVEKQENEKFKNKISKIIWRGNSTPLYRRKYLKSDNLYDIKCVKNGKLTYRGEEGSLFTKENSLSREQKSCYKYFLHLNGHEGSNTDGAYSSAFKWGLMSKSLVFYSAPVFYKEFWTHPNIFKLNEHFVFSKNPKELHIQLQYFIKNDNEAEKIANNAYNFFKKYLLDYDNILYYMHYLLSEYSKRLDYKVELQENDILISNIMHNEYIHGCK